MQAKPSTSIGDPSQATYVVVHPLVHDLYSNTSLIQEEIMTIESRNPAEALRRMVKSRGSSSTGRTLSSSYMSGGEIDVGIVTALVGQLKAKVFDVDFFKVVGDDPSVKSEVR